MNPLSSETVLTVSQLTRALKNLLEDRFRFIKICGEISNLRTPFSGHSYFTLKDEDAQIRGVLFKQQKRFVDLRLEDGQEVVCFGRISLYEPRGEYQIIIDSIELFGQGKLQLEFERLKKKLVARGYFDTEQKKPLPPYPRRLVIITSPTGAALQDFLKIHTIRNSPVHLQILPVRVQGNGAADEIRQAIKKANLLENIDAVVLCRGGGSIEDLWAFNEEIVAEAIYSSRLPIVTGIGHEIDFTIADLCCDFRCPTPTAAAEHLLFDAQALREHIAGIKRQIQRSFQRSLELNTRQLRHSRTFLANYSGVLVKAEHRLEITKSYLGQSMLSSLAVKEKSVDHLFNRLQILAPGNRIAVQEKHLQHLIKQLKTQMKYLLEKKNATFSRQASLLNSVSPLATLSRGYSVARKKQKRDDGYEIISSSDQVEIGDKINVLFHRGELNCQVQSKK